MFSLIISVTAVVLIVLITAVSMYYGGDAMTDGKNHADSATLINQSQQISAATELYLADNPGATSFSIEDLAPQYLTSVPEGWTLSSVPMPTVEGYIAYPIPGSDAAKQKLCEEVNKKLGIGSTVPSCSAISASFSGCCTN